MGYFIDLGSISIESYKAKLESADLLPSRLILKDQLDERFNYFQRIGINNVQELLQTLKKKDKIKELAEAEYLSEDYLVILLRELNSIHPKPNKIKDFPGISSHAITQMENAGIKDTVGLFEKVMTQESRKELSTKTGISYNEILELTKLTDLSRIRWVGAMFARVLYESGYDTVEKVSHANYENLYKTINQLNKVRNLYKGNIGLNDMRLCVNAAKEVPLEIEY